MADTVIKVEHVSKKFSRSLNHVMAYGLEDIGRNILGIRSRSNRLRKGEFWAVNDVSFEVKRGETLGIIGANGSGKSTLLKLINGIFMPESGKIEINGRVGALIEVGAGFHPMLTGRENIYINGAILGKKRKEIDDKYDEIISFAEIDDFIDSPVKHYSSGMMVRLGFSIAVCMMPEIILIDEVLSVGDLSFQNKSLRRLAEIRKRAHAMIFVSHNLDHIQNLCQKVLIMKNGKAFFFGKTEEALLKYYELSREIGFDQSKKEFTRYGKGNSSGDIDITGNGLLDENGMIVEKIYMEEPITLYFDLRITHLIENPIFSITLRDEKDNICLWYKSNEGKHKLNIKKLKINNSFRLIVSFSSPSFMPGLYRPTLGIYNGSTLERYEKIFSLSPFVIQGDVVPRGLINCDTHWDIQNMHSMVSENL